MKEPVFLSVILPVYNRIDCLKMCLECLSRQTLEREKWELIVVSDGGPAPIEACARAFKLLIPMNFMSQKNAGPAKARNNAMREAKGEHFVFLNDDIRFDENFLRIYYDFLQANPNHAVTGNTRWAPEIIKDEFAHWVSQQDHVFYNVTDPMDAPWEFWHTLNASIPRKYFDDGELFDEEYPDPAFEDTEFIYRLQKKHDCKIAFLSKAIVEHVHPFTFEEFCKKAQTRGKSAGRFVSQYPEKFERVLGIKSKDDALELIAKVEQKNEYDTVEQKARAGHAAMLKGYLEWELGQNS